MNFIVLLFFIFYVPASLGANEKSPATVQKDQDKKTGANKDLKQSESFHQAFHPHHMFDPNAAFYHTPYPNYKMPFYGSHPHGFLNFFHQPTFSQLYGYRFENYYPYMLPDPYLQLHGGCKLMMPCAAICSCCMASMPFLPRHPIAPHSHKLDYPKHRHPGFHTLLEDRLHVDPLLHGLPLTKPMFNHISKYPDPHHGLYALHSTTKVLHAKKDIKPEEKNKNYDLVTDFNEGYQANQQFRSFGKNEISQNKNDKKSEYSQPFHYFKLKMPDNIYSDSPVTKWNFK